MNLYCIFDGVIFSVAMVITVDIVDVVDDVVRFGALLFTFNLFDIGDGVAASSTSPLLSLLSSSSPRSSVPNRL